MKQFPKEWWEWPHRRHFGGGWRKCSRTHSRAQVAQPGRVCFVPLFCPQLSAPLLTSAVRETRLKQVAEKEGRQLQRLLRVSRSPGCFGRASCSPSLLDAVTFQRGTTLLPGPARSFHVSCQTQAAACWGAALLSLAKPV